MNLVKWKCDVPNCTTKYIATQNLPCQSFQHVLHQDFQQYEKILFFPFFNNIFQIFPKSNLVFAMFIKILPKIVEQNTLFGNEWTVEFNTLIALSSKLFGKILNLLVLF
jgi:hypothetical protein